MKKFIPLLIICLAVLCLFSSCGELFGPVTLEGTWSIDYREGRDYCNYRLVFSDGQVQIIKNVYGLSGHRLLKSSYAKKPMTYTVEPNGVMTLNYSVGVMKPIDITDTFTLDEEQRKIIWNHGFSEWSYDLSKESPSTVFNTPSPDYEQYTSGRFHYDVPEGRIQLSSSTLCLYSDGKYIWEGEGMSISLGNWEKSGDVLTLHNTNGWAFSNLTLEYEVDSETASHLGNASIDFPLLEEISYDYAWCVEYYR